MIDINTLIINPKNPRKIQEEELLKLRNSIQDFEKMLEARPIVIDENNIILGGNMRFSALKELGYTELKDEWVKQVIGWTEEEKDKFIIKDNRASGIWDWDILANKWDEKKLVEWGFNEWELGGNKEFNDSEFIDQDKKAELENQKKQATCPNCNHTFEI